jgi:hypothetical protein
MARPSSSQRGGLVQRRQLDHGQAAGFGQGFVQLACGGGCLGGAVCKQPAARAVVRHGQAGDQFQRGFVGEVQVVQDHGGDGHRAQQFRDGRGHVAGAQRCVARGRGR